VVTSPEGSTSAAEPVTKPRPRHALGLLVACLAGAGLAVQTRINGELAGRLNDGLAAAAISFGSGTILVLLLIAVSPSARAGVRQVRHALNVSDLHWWQLTGGLCGALLVASQGLASGVLGVAVFSVATIAGQVSSALLMDRLGIGPAGRQPVNGRRLLGAVLAVVAVLLSVADRFQRPAGLALTVLPLVAGIAVAWQQGINGRIGATARHARPNSLGAAVLPATAINFAVGTFALIVAAVVGIALHGPPHPAPAEPWLYLGGPLGVVFIAAGVAVVRVIGVLLLGLGMVAGQLISSLLLDLLVPSNQHPVSAATVLGTAITLVAAAAAAWPSRSGRMSE
jgi:transporter family-2 protein